MGTSPKNPATVSAAPTPDPPRPTTAASPAGQPNGTPTSTQVLELAERAAELAADLDAMFIRFQAASHPTREHGFWISDAAARVNRIGTDLGLLGLDLVFPGNAVQRLATAVGRPPLPPLDAAQRASFVAQRAAADDAPRTYGPRSSPNAGRLAAAMGWPPHPEPSPDEQTRFDLHLAADDESARQFYAAPALPRHIPPPPRGMLTTARTEALFAAPVDASQPLTRATATAAIRAAVRTWRVKGCAGMVAEEFGNHPETAVPRMRWALRTVEDLFSPARR